MNYTPVFPGKIFEIHSIASPLSPNSKQEADNLDRLGRTIPWQKVAKCRHEFSLRREHGPFSFAAPPLCEAKWGTVEQMRMMSTLCALLEYGET